MFRALWRSLHFTDFTDYGHKDKLFTNLRDTRRKLFVLMIMSNTSQTECCIYSEKYFLFRKVCLH